MDPFFSNLAVEEVPNYEFLLDDSHFAYVQPLSNHTSSTAKLEKKGSAPYMLKERRVEMTEISFIFELNFNIFDMSTVKEMTFWWFHFE